MRLYSITGYHESGIGLWTKVFENGADVTPGKFRVFVIEPGRDHYWITEHGHEELCQPVFRKLHEDNGQ